MFLAQVLSPDGSCQQAVNDAALKRLVHGLPCCSSKTSAYCQARGRLPTEMIGAVTRQVGGMIARSAPSWWHWQVRPVRLVDGATVTLADTEENQAAYPQEEAGLDDARGLRSSFGNAEGARIRGRGKDHDHDLPGFRGGTEERTEGALPASLKRRARSEK